MSGPSDAIHSLTVIGPVTSIVLGERPASRTPARRAAPPAAGRARVQPKKRSASTLVEGAAFHDRRARGHRAADRRHRRSRDRSRRSGRASLAGRLRDRPAVAVQVVGRPARLRAAASRPRRASARRGRAGRRRLARRCRRPSRRCRTGAASRSAPLSLSRSQRSNQRRRNCRQSARPAVDRRLRPEIDVARVGHGAVAVRPRPRSA